MGVALLLDERELAHPLIGLAQGDAVLLGEADEPLARPVQKLRIRRMAPLLRLHGRVHHGRREVGWLQRSGLRRNRKALLDQRVEPLLAHALPPARQRRAVEGEARSGRTPCRKSIGNKGSPARLRTAARPTGPSLYFRMQSPAISRVGKGGLPVPSE